jgi:hypothetical protein
LRQSRFYGCSKGSDTFLTERMSAYRVILSYFRFGEGMNLGPMLATVGCRVHDGRFSIVGVDPLDVVRVDGSDLLRIISRELSLQVNPGFAAVRRFTHCIGFIARHALPSHESDAWIHDI